MGVRGKLVLVCILGVLICSCNLFMVSEAVWLNLPASGTKCVSEEIHNNVVVLADYVVVSDNHSHIPSISVKGVELELRKLEGAVEAIHENLLYLKSREEELRSVSEVTNTRVALFGIMSLGVCIAVSALQVWHLKRYFQKKKLI
ncbi:hypothetical protein H0E87_001952 [Populus deltoides]|uniref:GOLD domain-containing protein n=1 Tax=Populus deltoides TaxID=3696 RepID=A0A8T2ZT08_POPDE|nr:hypothetical protein H0E87_001952 [Populus deltoides]